jgi:hypothetical protein
LATRLSAPEPTAAHTTSNAVTASPRHPAYAASTTAARARAGVFAATAHASPESPATTSAGTKPKTARPSGATPRFATQHN